MKHRLAAINAPFLSTTTNIATIVFKSIMTQRMETIAMAISGFNATIARNGKKLLTIGSMFIANKIMENN